MKMSLLPEQTYLGKLNIVEVYEATDEPCLFACQNASGHIFLSLLIDETAEHKHWLYLPLSNDRFAQVRSGQIDLRDSFRLAEDGFAHRVIVPIYAGNPLLQTIGCDALTDAMLPIAGEYLTRVNAQVA
jgi:hypothetical protein